MRVYKNDSLHSCWWCGEPAGFFEESVPQGYDSEGFPYAESYRRVWARCTRCRVSSIDFCAPHEDHNGTEQGVADPHGEARSVWNSGAVRIPLTIVLPQNMAVLERTPLPRRNLHINRTRNRIHVTAGRGIAEKLRRQLEFMFDSAGQIRPHLFTICEGMTMIHLDARLLSAAHVSKYDHDLDVVFESANSDVRFEKNRVDTAWLNRDFPRPPILDRVFDIISGG